MGHRAFLQITWDDRDVAALELLRGAAEFVQPEAGLATLDRIRTVAAVATVGQDRTDLTIEVHRHLRRPGERRSHDDDKG